MLPAENQALAALMTTAAEVPRVGPHLLVDKAPPPGHVAGSPGDGQVTYGTVPVSLGPPVMVTAPTSTGPAGPPAMLTAPPWPGPSPPEKCRGNPVISGCGVPSGDVDRSSSRNAPAANLGLKSTTGRRARSPR